MKTKIIALALAATVLGGGAAIAQDAPPPPGPGPGHGGLFLHADANKDGVVTRQELLASIDARFAKGDANKDGKITADEREAAHKAMRDARGGGELRRGMRGGRGMGPGRGGPDANQDGILTLDEVRAGPLKLFTYVDRNNDGRIDKAEAEAFRDATRATRGPGGPGKRGRHGRHGPPPADAPPPPGQ